MGDQRREAHAPARPWRGQWRVANKIVDGWWHIGLRTTDFETGKPIACQGVKLTVPIAKHDFRAIVIAD